MCRCQSLYPPYLCRAWRDPAHPERQAQSSAEQCAQCRRPAMQSSHNNHLTHISPQCAKAPEPYDVRHTLQPQSLYCHCMPCCCHQMNTNATRLGIGPCMYALLLVCSKSRTDGQIDGRTNGRTDRRTYHLCPACQGHVLSVSSACVVSQTPVRLNPWAGHHVCASPEIHPSSTALAEQTPGATLCDTHR